MQAVKDSFYICLRDRLAKCNPQRTVTVDGISRPAIVVVENEEPSLPRSNDVFYLQWGPAHRLAYNGGSITALDATVSYTTAGSGNCGTDRGRALAGLDEDLAAMCAPAGAGVNDYGTGQAVGPWSAMVWTDPQLGVSTTGATQVGREAKLTVLFYAEAN